MAERITWGYICEVMEDEERLFAEVQRQREETKKAQKVLVSSIGVLDAQDETDRQKLDSLVDLYLDGGVTKEVYLQKKRKIEKSIEGRDLENRPRSALERIGCTFKR